MKKRILSLVLALVLCLSLSATAFASSEASGEASGGMSGSSAVYAYAVTADGVEETEAEDVSLEGNITAAGISHFDFSSTEPDFVSVVG
ncbi:MAG: hypothetical protein LJU34_10470, partial [Oscillospiraceae bacterium]|nr:hypothetical protein [Oscillospiraceae bacterium]